MRRTSIGGIGPLSLFLALAGCSDGCDDRVLRVVTAPGGAAKAVLFDRNCGATTGYSTQLSILAGDEQLSGGGNIFVADDDHGKAVAGRWGGPWADVRWTSQDTLLIRYDRNARLFNRQERRGGIRIRFEPVELPPGWTDPA